MPTAHAIHHGLTVLPQTHHYWHGEKVTFGMLAMLMLTDRDPELIATVYHLCLELGLPTTLEDIGLQDVSDEDLFKTTEPACPGCSLKDYFPPASSRKLPVT